MAEDVPVIPIAELKDITAVNDKVKNVEVGLNGSNPIYEWTVEKDK